MKSESSKLTSADAAIAKFKNAFEHALYYRRGQAAQSASENDCYVALAYAVRDYLIERWYKTTQTHFETNPKFVYYLSAEYLIGPQLTQNMLFTDTTNTAHQAIRQIGYDIDRLVAQDVEPGLGNGGLGRLAACFLDSLATLDIPSMGYGIRYEYGIFNQAIKDGWQVERPDEWLLLGNPWEFPQPDNMVEVKFDGHTEAYTDKKGNYRVNWVPNYIVRGQPYHILVPGYKTSTVNMLRLWGARASREFDFEVFNVGDYARAVDAKILSENITKVLYPNDNVPEGQKLRLKQQYFFVACSLQDIIRRFKLRNNDWDQLPEKVVIQLNDTHPVVAIPELMRLLVDESQLEWDSAWRITQKTFAYTCHTLLPEALEKWPVALFQYLLPRHMEIVYEINRRFLDVVRAYFPNDPERIARMSIIEEGQDKKLRMAHLAVVGSFSVNGVAQLQSDLLTQHVFADFYALWPEKFNNKTNGVTPRRFVKLANPGLADLITSKLGDGWLNELNRLEQLEQHIDNADFRRTWRNVKQQNKQILADYIREHNGVQVNTDSIFDVMVKRLHQYKRQHLKALHIITLYNRIKANPDIDIVPRTFIFGAKAAPGYVMAKLIIKLINDIANVVNNDPVVKDRLKVVFLANFNVSLAQKIYPAADISEQISLAGKEASGTGNMKFALNGALTVGTLDGANIEIRDRVGAENFFLFGLTTDEVFALKERGYNPREHYDRNSHLRQAIDQIRSGYYSNGNTELFKPLVDGLLDHDPYMLLADYASYIEIQDRAEQAYRDVDQWTRMSILNTARCGFFSSDRTIREYCDDIWKVKPVKVEV
ncbi:glycogen/starch/alpha-glucan phosphorylase [candidate division KSB1 bacterium]|nr:glycogen/starch/alpha-glucan phosphorylase [candidate division KSB1 bacterium]